MMTVWGSARGTSSRLPMPRIYIHGRRLRRFLTDHPTMACLEYDFEPDVRELVCEPVQFDRVAMWADPRERL